MVNEPRPESAARIHDALERESVNVRALMAEIDRQRKVAREQHRSFTALTEEQLLSKLRRTNSPMIFFQTWDGKTSPGGTISYTIGINNPDATQAVWLFVHLFVGAANVAPDVSEAVTAVDTRFAQLTEPAFDGLTIEPGATRCLTFSLPVPAGVEKTNYMGNSFLFHSTWHDPADYLDRSLFVFAVA